MNSPFSLKATVACICLLIAFPFVAFAEVRLQVGHLPVDLACVQIVKEDDAKSTPLI